MDKQRFGQRVRRLFPWQPRPSEGKVQYLLEAEEQILRSIAVRAPVPRILNEICTALDCQIGNMVSLISLPEDDVVDTGEIARNAALFGLYIFFSGGIFGAGGGEIGSLEMYCCTARDPFFHELQWIERAGCLAAIAIECDSKAGPSLNPRSPRNAHARGSVLGWPVSLN
jgi:hypothetical protein